VPLTNVIVEIHVVLLFTLHNTKNIAYHITEMLIFYAGKLMVMGCSKNLCVFHENLMLTKYTVVHRHIHSQMNSSYSELQSVGFTVFCVIACVFNGVQLVVGLDFVCIFKRLCITGERVVTRQSSSLHSTHCT